MKFGKYTLLDRISHGGMAEVYRAKTFGAAGFERIVAIKLLLPNVAMDQDFVTMLIDEAKIAGQLSHANIAQIFDLGMAEGRYYIVQEYVNGLDLRKILRRLARSGRRLSVAQAVHIIIKACEGLDYAHNKRDGTGSPLNLVHRDVSPQNILISNEGEVKLIDFGIAKAEGRATRTLAGLVKGKFAYMSPEQIRGLPVDRRSDVFAAGIVLHELLTTKPLFRRKSEFETLKRARSGVIEPPSKLNPDVPKELDEVVLGALARHVEDRYASSVELRDALWQFSRSSGNFYSRNELAAWMGAEIAEEIVTNTGDVDSAEFPSIELADGGPDSGPTIVDPSGQERESAQLSGEVKSQTASSRIITADDSLEQPSVEISSDALSGPRDARRQLSVEERPTLLYDPDADGASTSNPSQRMTAAVPSASGSSSLPTPERSNPSQGRPTLIAASAPIAPIGVRHPDAPISEAPPEPPTLQGAPSYSPSPVPRPLGGGLGPAPLSNPGFGPPPQSGPSPSASQGTGPSSSMSEAWTKEHQDDQSRGSSRWLIVLATLVLLGAIGFTISLIATQ